MARRSEHSQEEIREMILTAAENIIMEQGIGALKVRKIAMDIGYTVGSVYMVFDSMADLIHHIKGKTLDDIALHLNEVDTCQHPSRCIMGLSETYLAYAKRHFNRWSMLFEHRTADEAAIPEWYRYKLDALYQPIETQMKKLIPELSDMDAKSAARALWSGIHGICILWLNGVEQDESDYEIERALALLVENFLRGWTTPPICELTVFEPA